ncbi:OmpP1/FadL family transporter [Nitrospira sp. NS4]|uniref:OmpP1/FadL family transporter n=1 Tax=Nitrospira sp. NS4 TaxID=3414498 RepID=UPI003C2DCEC3
MVSRTLFAIVAMAVASLLPDFVQAGGLSLYEIATSDVGLASAGWAARAQDPATLLKNPAGMSLLEGNQFQGGAQLLHASIGFSPGPGTSVSGNDGGNPIGTLPALSLFYVHGLGQDVKVGLGLFSNFGLGMNYDSGWVGRYYAINNTLLGLSVMPALSYRINEKLSIGVAANVMAGYLDYSAAINNNVLAIANRPDGKMAMNDTTVGAGGNVGLLYEPRKGTRFGVTYYSQVKLDFGTTPTFTGLSNPVLSALQNQGSLNKALDLGVTVPQSVMVSSYHELTDRWAMMLDFGWQDWSQFGKVEIGLTGSSPATLTTTTNLDYQDTYHVALGNRYRLNQAWLLNTGFAWDSSMIKNQNYTVSLPVGQIYRFGLGAEWQASPKLNVAFSYELAYGGDLPVNQNRGPLAGSVVGQFPGVYTNFFQVSFIWGSVAKG